VVGTLSPGPVHSGAYGAEIAQLSLSSSNTFSYSPECAEGKFCELYLCYILRSSRVRSALLLLWVGLHVPVHGRLEVRRERDFLVPAGRGALTSNRAGRGILRSV
jgi:hypothetical protein